MLVENVPSVASLILFNRWKRGERCSFAVFPCHPKRTQRRSRSCGASPFKALLSKHGELVVKGKECCVLLHFSGKPGFDNKCEEHKKYVSDSDLLGDIYDGRESLIPQTHLGAY